MAKSILSCLPGWNNDIVKDFVNAPCYKIIATDMNDEMIPFEASLKYGVSQAEKNQEIYFQFDQLLSTFEFIFNYDKKFFINCNLLDSS